MLLKADAMATALYAPLVAAQALLGARVIGRFLRSAHGEYIGAPDPAAPLPAERIVVLVPVLNERLRLAACLDGLIAQGPEVASLLIIDGGSTDGTQALVATYAARDARICLLDASPVPADWNGKAWGLEVGMRHLRLDDPSAGTPRIAWVLTVDADVRPAAALAGALLAHAQRVGVAALSVATLQELSGAGEALVHPALLTSMVYRFGSPGHVARRVSEAQANGQCMLIQRDALERCGGFASVRESICEDVTLARALVAAGERVGFYEAGNLVAVRMYASAGDAWRNWSRSLPMRDRYFGVAGVLGLFEVALVQALPLPLTALGLLGARAGLLPAWLVIVPGALLALRLGVLAGMVRGYRRVLWPYWLSPLLDLPVALQLWINALRRRHRWRGRVILRGELRGTL